MTEYEVDLSGGETYTSRKKITPTDRGESGTMLRRALGVGVFLGVHTQVARVSSSEKKSVSLAGRTFTNVVEQ